MVMKKDAAVGSCGKSQLRGWLDDYSTSPLTRGMKRRKVLDSAIACAAFVAVCFTIVYIAGIACHALRLAGVI